MKASWRARCRACRWRSKGDGPALLGLDSLNAHLTVAHRVTP